MIYVFLADGFEETEAIAPIDILKRFGKEVVTVGIRLQAHTQLRLLPILPTALLL